MSLIFLAFSEIVIFSADAYSGCQLRVSCVKWVQLEDENVSLEFTENVLRLLLHFSSGKTEALQWSKFM